MAEDSHRPLVPHLKMPPVTVGRRRKTVLLGLVFLACLAWIVLTRLHTAEEPLDRDICTQILMGRVLADGGRLYVDTLEFKPPGMFVIWQVIHQLVGTSPPVVVWTNILVTSLSLIGVFMAASAKPWGFSAGLWAMGFWTLISGDLMLEANQPSNEVFINSFMVWGIALWMRAETAPAGQWRYAAAGFFLGCATLIKPVLITVVCMALGCFASGGLAPKALKRRAGTIAWVLLPVAVGWALMVLYFVFRGRGSALYDGVVRYAIYYAQSQGGHAEMITPGIWLNILQGFTDKLFPPRMFFLAPLSGLAILGIVGSWLDGRRPQALTLAGCLLGTLLSVSIPGTYYPHYYQLYLPILVVGAGWGIAAVANSLRQPMLAWGIGLSALLLLLWHVVPDLRLHSKTSARLQQTEPGGALREIVRCGAAVDRMLLAGESVYVWGEDPGVYYYSHRRPASGIFWANRLIWGPSKKPATLKVLDDLKKNQPPLVLIEEGSQLPSDHPVGQWIYHHYFRSSKARFSELFAVYLRRDSALAARLSTNQAPFVLTLTNVNPGFLKHSADDLLRTGRSREARAYLDKIVALETSHPEIDNQLAWLLSTSSDAGLRDGSRAVQLAEHACRFTGFKEPVYVGTLAAAYAEAGQFDTAILAAQQACELASKSGASELLAANQKRLVLYRAHQPYHEDADSTQIKPSTGATPRADR